MRYIFILLILFSNISFANSNTPSDFLIKTDAEELINFWLRGYYDIKTLEIESIDTYKKLRRPNILIRFSSIRNDKSSDNNEPGGCGYFFNYLYCKNHGHVFSGTIELNYILSNKGWVYERLFCKCKYPLQMYLVVKENDLEGYVLP